MGIRRLHTGQSAPWLIRRHPSPRARPLLTCTLLAGVLLVLLTADLPWKHAAAETPIPVPTMSASPTVSTGSLEEPLRLIREARRAYARIRDYRYTLIKQERLPDGTLPAETVLDFQAKTSPFSVHLAWREPSNLNGQEAVYVEGRNNGKLRARGAGALGLIGFVSLDPRSPRAMGNSRYAITEAGLGTLIERFAAGWELERRIDKTRVKIDLGEFAGRPCIRVETDHPVRVEGLLFGRSVVWFDQVTALPVRVENFDWPKDGQATGELSEVFSFVNVALNVGLAETIFEK